MAVFSIISIVMGIIWGLYYAYAAAPGKWPQTQATVLGKSVATRQVTSGHKPGSLNESHSVTHHGTYHYGKVHYQYQVAEKVYECSDIRRTSLGYGLQEDAEKAMEKYNEGDTVTIRYNPANPEEAVLETDLHWLVYAPFGIIAIFVAGAVVMGFLIWG